MRNPQDPAAKLRYATERESRIRAAQIRPGSVRMKNRGFDPFPLDLARIHTFLRVLRKPDHCRQEDGAARPLSRTAGEGFFTPPASR
jgi:hypothetical protein